jgi:hypothetical protein
MHKCALLKSFGFVGFGAFFLAHRIHQVPIGGYDWLISSGHFFARYCTSPVTCGSGSRRQIGDWFVLFMLGKNINPLVYKELISELRTFGNHIEIHGTTLCVFS